MGDCGDGTEPERGMSLLQPNLVDEVAVSLKRLQDNTMNLFNLPRPRRHRTFLPPLQEADDETPTTSTTKDVPEVDIGSRRSDIRAKAASSNRTDQYILSRHFGLLKKGDSPQKSRKAGRLIQVEAELHAPPRDSSHSGTTQEISDSRTIGENSKTTGEASHNKTTRESQSDALDTSTSSIEAFDDPYIIIPDATISTSSPKTSKSRRRGSNPLAREQASGKNQISEYGIYDVGTGIFQNKKVIEFMQVTPDETRNVALVPIPKSGRGSPSGKGLARGRRGTNRARRSATRGRRGRPRIERICRSTDEEDDINYSAQHLDSVEVTNNEIYDTPDDTMMETSVTQEDSNPDVSVGEARTRDACGALENSYYDFSNVPQISPRPKRKKQKSRKTVLIEALPPQTKITARKIPVLNRGIKINSRLQRTTLQEEFPYFGDNSTRFLVATPEPTSVSPETVDVATETINNTPETINNTPEAIDIAHETVDVAHETVDVASKTVEVAPVSMNVTPKTTNASPKTVKATPATIEVTPEDNTTGKVQKSSIASVNYQEPEVRYKSGRKFDGSSQSLSSLRSRVAQARKEFNMKSKEVCVNVTFTVPDKNLCVTRVCKIEDNVLETIKTDKNKLEELKKKLTVLMPSEFRSKEMQDNLMVNIEPRIIKDTVPTTEPLPLPSSLNPRPEPLLPSSLDPRQEPVLPSSLNPTQQPLLPSPLDPRQQAFLPSPLNPREQAFLPSPLNPRQRPLLPSTLKTKEQPVLPSTLKKKRRPHLQLPDKPRQRPLLPSPLKPTQEPLLPSSPNPKQQPVMQLPIYPSQQAILPVQLNDNTNPKKIHFGSPSKRTSSSPIKRTRIIAIRVGGKLRYQYVPVSPQSASAQVSGPKVSASKSINTHSLPETPKRAPRWHVCESDSPQDQDDQMNEFASSTIGSLDEDEHMIITGDIDFGEDPVEEKVMLTGTYNIDLPDTPQSAEQFTSMLMLPRKDVYFSDSETLCHEGPSSPSYSDHPDELMILPTPNTSQHSSVVEDQHKGERIFEQGDSQTTMASSNYVDVVGGAKSTKPSKARSEEHTRAIFTPNTSTYVSVIPDGKSDYESIPPLDFEEKPRFKELQCVTKAPEEYLDQSQVFEEKSQFKPEHIFVQADQTPYIEEEPTISNQDNIFPLYNPVDSAPSDMSVPYKSVPLQITTPNQPSCSGTSPHDDYNANNDFRRPVSTQHNIGHSKFQVFSQNSDVNNTVMLPGPGCDSNTGGASRSTGDVVSTKPRKYLMVMMNGSPVMIPLDKVVVSKASSSVTSSVSSTASVSTAVLNSSGMPYSPIVSNSSVSPIASVSPAVSYSPSVSNTLTPGTATASSNHPVINYLPGGTFTPSPLSPHSSTVMSNSPNYLSPGTVRASPLSSNYPPVAPPSYIVMPSSTGRDTSGLYPSSVVTGSPLPTSARPDISALSTLSAVASTSTKPLMPESNHATVNPTLPYAPPFAQITPSPFATQSNSPLLTASPYVTFSITEPEESMELDSITSRSREEISGSATSTDSLKFPIVRAPTLAQLTNRECMVVKTASSSSTSFSHLPNIVKESTINIVTQDKQGIDSVGVSVETVKERSSSPLIRSRPSCQFLFSSKYKALSGINEFSGPATGTPVKVNKPRVPFLFKRSLVRKKPM